MKKRALLPILGMILLANAPSTAHGQQLVVGRVSAVSSGALLHPRVSFDSVTLSLSRKSQRVRIPLDVVRRLEVQRGQERATDRDPLRGLLIGAGAGAVFGLVLGALGEAMHGCGCTLSSGAIFAGVGGVIGLGLSLRP